MPETDEKPKMSNGEVKEEPNDGEPIVKKEKIVKEEEEADEKKENINEKKGENDKDRKESTNKSGDEKKSNGEMTEEEEAKAAEWNFTREPRNRVKLYVLCEQRVWDDRGTGHVACLPLPDHSGFHAVVVRLESNEKNVLESKILMDTVYQKQQETLIVWSESDTCDLALSFQEKSGCEELWTKICEVQGKDPKDASESSPDGDDDDNDGGCTNGEREGGRGGRGDRDDRRGGKDMPAAMLPPVELGRLNEIEYFMSNNANSAIQRERISQTMENTNFVYISKLCDIFKMCEDLDDIKGLKALHNIARYMFMLNRNSVVESLVDDKHIRDVVGMLEYDPSSSEPKPHREFLFEKAQFKEILPMEKETLKETIHHVYRVSYIQDVCLPAPSLFEDNHLNALNSYLFFKRVDIVSMVTEDKKLVKELFGQLKDSTISNSRRRELSSFLKELCAMSSSLQQSGPQSKESFYKCLLQNEVLSSLESCMRSGDSETRANTTEVLHMVSEYSAQTVRDFLIKQGRDKKDNDILLNMLLDHIVTDRDSELTSATQMLQVMRMLLDPDNMAQKGEKNEFLSIFYNKCLPFLTKTMVDIVSGVTKPKQDDYHTAKKLSLVLRLLNFCVSHHALPMRSFIIRQDFLNKVLVLLNSKHHFLALYALKLLRSVIQQKDEFYYNYVTEKNVFDKVIECLVDNGRRNNLLNSAMIELFEFMRQEDMKPVIAHVVERHMDTLMNHRYVRTFGELKLKYEQNKDREEQMRKAREEGGGFMKDKDVMGRWKNRERDIEKEEQWFDNDDDEEEDEDEKEKKETTTPIKAGAPSPGRKSGAEPMFPKMKTSKGDDDDGVFAPGNKLSSALGLGGLASAPKIVIKVLQMDGNRSRSPSPGTIPREDEVSSSQAAAASTPSPSSDRGQKRPASTSPNSSPAVKKGLVEYDDSDPDSDPEEGGGSIEGSSKDDSVPSSSTGSPTGEGGENEPPHSPSTTNPSTSSSNRKDREEYDDNDDDVSSTSGNDDDVVDETVASSPKCNSRKREGDIVDDDIGGIGKRIRVDDTSSTLSSSPSRIEPRPSPPPVDPVAQ